MTQTKEHVAQPARKNAGRLANLAALAALGLTGALTAPAQAIQPPTQYSISNTGAAVGGTSSEANALSNNGQVAGDFFNGTKNSAFYFNGSTSVNLNTILGNPAKGSFAYGINDSGVTVGYFKDASFFNHAFSYSPSSNTAQDLSSAFPLGTTDSEANDISNNGQIVGRFNNGQIRAFSFKNGVALDLSSVFPIGTNYSNAYAVNDSGKIIGEFDTPANDHAFYYSNGVATDLNPALGNPVHAYAYGINSSNQVVGEVNPTSGFDFAFLYNANNGTATSLRSSLPSGTTDSYAYGINDSGTVVGEFYSTNFSSNHAFVYSGGVGQDLNNLIPAGTGWVLLRANAINNNGQIAGTGTIGGQSRAFVLSLATINGSGTLSGNNGSFSFNATASPNAPGAKGTFTFTRNGGPFIFGAPIQTLSISGNTATFGGVYIRDKNGNPSTSYTVILNRLTNTFTLYVYSGSNPTPFRTVTGTVASGGFNIVPAPLII